MPETKNPRADEAREPTPQEKALEREERAEAKAEGRPFSESNVQAAMANRAAEPALYEVLVDTFGSHVQHTKGQILRKDDSPYDLEDAHRRGVVRRISVAEARSGLPSFTMPLTGDNRDIDWEQQVAARYYAGLPAVDDPTRGPHGERATVTGPQGPAEPEDLAKPTIPDLKGGAPAANPVLVAEGKAHEEVVRDHFAKLREEARKGK